MLTPRHSSRTTVIGSNIWVLGRYVGIDNWSSSYEIYSANKYTWKAFEPTNDCLTDFSVC